MFRSQVLLGSLPMNCIAYWSPDMVEFGWTRLMALACACSERLQGSGSGSEALDAAPEEAPELFTPPPRTPRTNSPRVMEDPGEFADLVHACKTPRGRLMLHVYRMLVGMCALRSVSFS